MKITILKMRRNLDEDEAFVYEGHVDKNELVPTMMEFFNHDQPTSDDLRELGYGSGGYESYKAYYEENDMWVDVDFCKTLTFADRVKERINQKQ
tara:strand:+ start:262 stop:543 length:282 start_codon:yes stop_codon:yes gene_type:complete